MKKAITAGILSMAMIMSMAGCGSSDGKGEADTTGDVSETTYTIGISPVSYTHLTLPTICSV